MPKGMKHQARFTKHQVTGHVTCFFQGCVFPHPEPKKFRGTACSSFPQKFPLFPLIRGKKGVILGRDKKISSPVSPCTTLSTSIRFVQPLGSHFQSFSLYIAVAVAITYPTHMNFVWKKSGFLLLSKKIGRPPQTRLLKKMVHADKIFPDFHTYVILDKNAVMR